MGLLARKVIIGPCDSAEDSLALCNTNKIDNKYFFFTTLRVRENHELGLRKQNKIINDLPQDKSSYD